MIRYDPRSRAFAVCLSFLAGYVDAIGFIKLGGFFVSFMSGNSTRLAVGLIRGSPSAAIAAGLIATFVVGVLAGTLTGHFMHRHRLAAVLGLVTVLLASAAAFGMTGMDIGVIAAMVLAMGAENAAFERNGEVSIGVTYMTGTLVKVGQGLAAALLGGPPFGWAPYLFLWSGLILGAIIGSAIYPFLGLGALWIATVIAAILALVSLLLLPKPERHE